MMYSLKELARATGIRARTLRYYVESGVVPTAHGAGSNAHYGEEHFYRACAVKALRKRGFTMVAIRDKLEGASHAELCAIAGLPAPPRQIDPEEIERAHEAHAQGQAQRQPPARAQIGAYRAEIATARQAWTRVVLCPGIELHVSGAADEEALRVAREIESIYAVRGSYRGSP